MSRPTNCPNCGAPLHGYKCDYCGTEFERDRNEFFFVRESPEIRTLASHYVVDSLMFQADADKVMPFVERRLAESFAKDILKYAEIETWLDPERLQQHIGARVKVVMPRGEGYERYY